MDWDDPAKRLALIEKVGPQEYNKQLMQHRDESVVSIVGGHKIRTVGTRFGTLYEVGETGRAFSDKDQAEGYATNNAVASDAGELAELDADLSVEEKQEILAALAELDVSIRQTGPDSWRFVQERVGDGYEEFSDDSYSSEDAAILAAAANWSV